MLGTRLGSDALSRQKSIEKSFWKMNKLALKLAASATLAFAIPATPISAASLETYEARSTATQAAAIARQHMLEVFGKDSLKPGQYLWREDAGDGDPRV